MDTQFAHDDRIFIAPGPIPMPWIESLVVRYPSPTERKLARRDGARLVSADGKVAYFYDGLVYLIG